MANKPELLKDQAFIDSVLKAANKDEVISLFKAQGLELTSEKIDEALAAAKKSAEGQELSATELDSVAGGGFFGDFWEGFKVGFVKPVTGIEILIQAAQGN